MILAEKIAMLRKKNGWSQEELAMKLNVSRQSVSKWESTASMPDLDKIIRLSEIFGVTTDFLIKDEVEADEKTFPVEAEWEMDVEKEVARSVSLEEANTFMNQTAKIAKWIAAGVALCILSPIPLIMLGGFAEYGVVAISEDTGGSIGVIIMLLMIGIAVMIFILKGMQLGRYDYLETERIELEYGVYGIVEKKRQDFETLFRVCIAAGVVLCIFGVIPLFLSNLVRHSEFWHVCSVGILLGMVACGVFLFVWSGMIYGSYQKLLQEDDYHPKKKKANKRVEAIAGIYWCLVTVIYLAVSFSTMNWGRTWILWPCAGVFWAALSGIVNMIYQEKN